MAVNATVLRFSGLGALDDEDLDPDTEIHSPVKVTITFTGSFPDHLDITKIVRWILS